MNHYVEKTGKNVQEALSLALIELDAEEDDIEYEILEEGNKGLLGLIGSKQAKVRVWLNIDRRTTAEDFIFDVLEKMGIEATVSSFESEEDNSINITIEGPDSGIIIGRRGETLDALQYLASLVVNKDYDEYKRVVLDVENYRKKRKDALVRLSNKLAQRVVITKKSITLEPMNPYERRIIHSCLQENRSVKTYSVGDEPNRKVVIATK